MEGPIQTLEYCGVELVCQGGGDSPMKLTGMIGNLTGPPTRYQKPVDVAHINFYPYEVPIL